MKTKTKNPSYGFYGTMDDGRNTAELFSDAAAWLAKRANLTYCRAGKALDATYGRHFADAFLCCGPDADQDEAFEFAFSRMGKSESARQYLAYTASQY